MSTPEGKLKSKLREFCKKNDILWACNSQQGMGSVGFPDYTLFTKSGNIIFVEVKTPKNSLTPKQKLWKEQLEERKLNYLCMKSDVDCLELLKYI
jgi:hypothetical protein